MDDAVIPPLVCPFPGRISPHAEALGEVSLAWARRMGLLDDPTMAGRFVAERYWLLIARAFPDADFGTLQVVADWNSWGFTLDDLGDASGAGRDQRRMRQLFAAILGVLAEEQPVTPPGPLFVALDDVWRRLRVRSTAGWRAEMRRTLTHSFTSNLWEAANRAQGIIPARGDYLRMRVFTGAWLTYLRLYELIAGIDLPPEGKKHPLLRDYLTAVNRAIVCANDLVSCAKEQALGDTHNLVVITRHKLRCDLGTALRAVADLHNAEMGRALALEAQLQALPASYQGAIEQYLAFCHAFVRANLDWSVESGRYGALTLPVVERLPETEPAVGPLRGMGPFLWLAGMGMVAALGMGLVWRGKSSGRLTMRGGNG